MLPNPQVEVSTFTPGTSTSMGNWKPELQVCWLMPKEVPPYPILDPLVVLNSATILPYLVYS